MNKALEKKNRKMMSIQSGGVAGHNDSAQRPMSGKSGMTAMTGHMTANQTNFSANQTNMSNNGF